MKPPPKGYPAALGRDAMVGVLGQLVRELEPHTEAGNEAIAFSALATLGAMIGRGAYFTIESARHCANIFVAQVGKTGDGRKDTGLGRVRSLSHEIDPEWTKTGRLSGLSSGEGLIHAVRDGDGIEDPGVPDKRKLVIASEFASVLKHVERPTNILSPVLREAWDGVDLGNLTVANNGRRATEPHISILANITDEELRRTLTATEVANGLANRFLWICTRRSKLLPDGGGAFEWPTAITAWLRDSVTRAQSVGELRRTSAARDAWHAIYFRHHSVERRGIFGSLRARGDAHQVRLALLLALLDQSDAIEPEHVLGAAELWRYAEDSARFIFGESLGDDVADKIVQRLSEAGGAGLTTTGLINASGRHVSGERLRLALRTLVDAGRVSCTVETTGGAPAKRWRLRPCEPSEVSELRGGNHGLTSLPSHVLTGASIAVGGVQ